MRAPGTEPAGQGPSDFARAAYGRLAVVLSDLEGAARTVAEPVHLAALTGAGHGLHLPSGAFGDPAADAAAAEVVSAWRRGSARVVDEVRELGDLLVSARDDYAERDRESARVLAAQRAPGGIGRAGG